MPRNVPFQEPSSYLRYVGAEVGESRDQSFRDVGASELRFIRLNAKESPIRIPFTFAAIAAGQRSAVQAFSDMVSNYNHILQVFMGISVGARARVFLPVDERILKLDENSLTQTVEKDTGIVEYEDSPIENPRYNFWVAPGKNYVPAIDVENTLSVERPLRAIDVQVLFYMAKYTYDLIDPAVEPDLHDKLKRFQIPSRHVTFGGRI